MTNIYKNILIKYGTIGIIICLIFSFIISIVLISYFCNLIASIGSKQVDIVSSTNLEGDDPNVKMVKPNAIYSDEYLRLVNNYVFNAYKKNSKIDGYASLDKVVFNFKGGNLSLEEAYLKEVEESKQSNTLRPFAMPINMKEAKRISSYWSQERGNEYHSGWDISANAGTNVYAPADFGEVVQVSFPSKINGGIWNGNTSSCYKLNNEIHIKYVFNGREYLIVFAHLYPNSARVKVGDIVRKGQKVAEVGSTGCSTGNHLHIELRLDSNYKTHTDFFKYTDLNSTFS